jgi:hypothetical protein
MCYLLSLYNRSNEKLIQMETPGTKNKPSSFSQYPSHFKHENPQINSPENRKQSHVANSLN